MCPGRSVLKSHLIVAPDWGIFPRKGSQVQPFLFKADNHFYGSRLAVVEGHGLPPVPLGLFAIDQSLTEQLSLETMIHEETHGFPRK